MKLARSIVKCKLCEDILESKHNRDFVTCKCGAISIDGGTDSPRYLGDSELMDFSLEVYEKE